MTINGSPTYAAELARLVTQLGEMQQRITQLERGQATASLANASIEGGALTINDDTGSPTIILGLQDDGTYAHAAVNASPPPQPSDPVVSPAILSAMVSWDGNMAGGAPPLADLAGVQVHCSIAASFTPGPNTLQSTFIAQGVRPVGGLLAGYTYYICLVTVNQAGLTSAPSAIVPVVPSPAISPGQVINQPVLIGSTTLGYASTTPRGPMFYDFEVGLQGFTLAGGGTLGLTTSQSFTGAQAAIITCDGVTQPKVSSPSGTAGIPVVEGDPLWVQFIYAASINLNNTYVGIQWFDKSGNFISETDQIDGVISGGLSQWYAYSIGDTAPADGFAAVVFGDHNVDAGGTQIIFDTVRASGNLGFSFSAIAGVDPEGNTFDQGITVYALPGLQTAIAVKDAAGADTISSIDAGGNFTGESVIANTDLFVAGESLTNDILPPYPLGLVAYVGIPSASLPFPASQTTNTILVEELDFQAVAGRRYMLVLEDINVSIVANGGVKILLNGTSDGSTPTTSSPLLARGMMARASDTNNWTPPFIHSFTSANGGLWRMLLSILGNAGACQIVAMEVNPGDDADGTLNCRMSLYDMGIAGPMTGAAILSSGGTSGVTTKKTYTTTYNIPHTHSYQGSDGGNSNLLIDNDGTCFQGGDYGDTYNGRAKTWFVLPTAMAADLSGATINWAKMYLNNNHSWYHSGMTLSLGTDNKSTWGGTASDPSGSNYIHVGFSEGQAKWFTLPSSHYATLRDPVHNSLVAWAGTNDLTYYGYFAGPSQSGRPQLQINYTK
jgi:hypothetical protein